ncbi:hypothetical protein [Saccharospirillum alexandrii]|uniref:hypothetical protein n=1 Tax=Saccharospirillum alexandrii TaxID=2448477 RepID=UPI003735CE93
MSSELNACIKIAACICAKDGVISQLEERAIFQIVLEKFPRTTAKSIDLAIDEFFESNTQLEHYMSLVNDIELRKFTLDMARRSASADGLDINENIALNKALLIWGLEQDA